MRLLATPLKLNDIESFAAAGADELIFGTSFFSVRSAAVFSVDQYEEIRCRTEKAHVKMLVLMNRFFVEEELPACREHLMFLKKLGVDGIYFTDEAVLAIAKELEVAHLLIYQPDTLLTNHPDVNYYLSEELKRIVLSKEITVEEIIEIAHNSPADRLELIVHGRVVVMHSKRPLISNYMEFINNDLQVKNNRHLIIEEETRHERMPILEDEQGTHVFSAYVLASFKELSSFIQAGIGAARIDGIFQSSDEIANVVRLYDQLRKEERSAEEIYEMFTSAYPDIPVDSGFYYRPTSTTKVGDVRNE